MVGGQDTIHWSRGIMFSLNSRIGNHDKDMQMCEDIIEVYQKERFLQLVRNDSRSKKKSMFNTLVLKDVMNCEKTILAVCEGRFPK